MSSQISQDRTAAINAESFNASPDWSLIYKELARPGVTLKLLWLQHRSQSDYSCSYQHFCHSYRYWLNTHNLQMRYHVSAGQYLFAGFVDVKDSYTIDSTTGEAFPSCIFLAVLGTSRYCYAEPCIFKDIDTWIAGHIRALEVFHGTSKYLAPVLPEDHRFLSRHACYRELARRCSTVIQDLASSKPFPPFKNSMRTAVFDVPARWLASCMRHNSFVGMPEANSVVQHLIQRINNRSFRNLQGSPLDWFETLERSCLSQLPSMPADQDFWSAQKAKGNQLSLTIAVPPNVIEQPGDVKVSLDFVQAFFQGELATSLRMPDPPHKHSAALKRTVTPPKAATDWSPERLLRWANKIGPTTAHLTSTILAHSNNSPSGVRSCLGLLTLETKYGRHRLEAACRLAASKKSWTIRLVRSILDQGLDQTCLQLRIAGLT